MGGGRDLIRIQLECMNDVDGAEAGLRPEMNLDGDVEFAPALLVDFVGWCVQFPDLRRERK